MSAQYASFVPHGLAPPPRSYRAITVAAAMLMTAGCGSSTTDPGGPSDVVDALADVTTPDATPDTAPETSVDTETPDTPGPTDTSPTDTSPTDTSPTDTSPTDTSPTDTSTPTCPTVTLTGPLQTEVPGSVYLLGLSSQRDLGFGGSAPDIFIIELFASEDGDFDLSSGVNTDYATCDPCVLALVDLVDDEPSLVLFQSQGTLSVTGLADDTGPTFALNGVGLVEVDIAEDLSSTPVTGGLCVTLADTTLEAVTSTAPGEWTCDPDYYGDSTCDCGCGIPDLDCPDASIEDCDFCESCGQSAFGSCALYVDPDDTTRCVERPPLPEDWTCPESWYGDLDCDCGCGTRDIDCETTDVLDECEYCLDCPGFGTCFERVDPDDTTQCVVSEIVVPDGWTCSELDYGDNLCDCGCGVKDLDCQSTTDLDECDFCLSCPGEGECDTEVDPANTTQCLPAP